jgi:putative phosphoesterase
LRIAIISDIHSNKYALNAVLHDIKKKNANGLIVLGDIFGYYPWAYDTYKLLVSQKIIACIKGNHDLIVLEENEDISTRPSYYKAARLNRMELLSNSMEAIGWLNNLKLNDSIQIEKYKILLCHGTPSDSENGRYFPDDRNTYDWFPVLNQVLFLGHTHYPLFHKTVANGIIFNPGSVGQPRDGNPYPSWGLWTIANNSFELKRTEYDYKHVVKELEERNWDKRAILALSKNYKGTLNI